MKFEEYAENIGFTLDNKVYQRDIKGYKIYLKNYQYMILSVPSFFIPLDKELTKEEIKILQDAAYANACFKGTTTTKGDTLIVTLPEGNKLKEEKQKIMDEILNNVIKTLEEDNYKPLSVCPICKNEASYSSFGDSFIPIHEECKNNYLNQLKEKANNQKGFKLSYLFAIILAILGTSLGLLTAFLLAFFNKDYFTGLIALGPILGATSTLLAKAPKQKVLDIIIGSIICLMVLGMVLFTILYIPSQTEVSIQSYIIDNGAIGLRKIIFGSILSLAGFGILKFLSKFKINYQEELKKFD
ncbi:MAG: hypothetical protein K6B64_05845 [Acholeplasmatales bacterium]|nr:hypothetical protein [Acholeplasmatales bacterium]